MQSKICTHVCPMYIPRSGWQQSSPQNYIHTGITGLLYLCLLQPGDSDTHLHKTWNDQPHKLQLALRKCCRKSSVYADVFIDTHCVLTQHVVL